MGLLLKLKEDGDGRERKSYDKTPKPRKQSNKVNQDDDTREAEEIFEDRDVGQSIPSINSSKK